MIKPGSLRAAIVAAVPELKKNPDRLLVFVDCGKIVSTGTKSISFEYRYSLNLILTDFAGDADQVMAAVVAWTKDNQPELFDNFTKRDQGITFEVDHLNHKTVDLAITLADLSESILVKAVAGGKFETEHLPEPIPEWRREGLA